MTAGVATAPAAPLDVPDADRPAPRGPGTVPIDEQLAWPALIGAVGAASVFAPALVISGSLLLALGASAGVLVLCLAVASPLVALVVLCSVEVTQVGAVLLEYGVPSPLVLTQAVALLSLGVAAARQRLSLTWSPVALGLVLLLVSRALSVLDAVDPEVALATVVEEVRDALTFAVALTLLWTSRGTTVVIRVCVLALAGMALLTAVNEFALGALTDLGGFDKVLRNLDVGAATFRHSGPIGDSNFWGRVLVMFLPFAAALALSAGSRAAAALWWSAGGSLLLGVWLTQSRGTFLAMAAGAVVLLLLAGWRYARWLALTPLVVGLLLVLPATGSRLSSLADLAQTGAGGGDLSLLLRVASQEAGLNMFEDRPLLGIGAGNYTPASAGYTSGLPYATSGELDTELAPHNAFLEFAAEGGIVGLAGFVLFLFLLYWCAGRAWAQARRLPRELALRPRLIAAAACASLVSWTLSSLVLHVRQFRTLLVLAAVIAVLELNARLRPAPGEATPRRRIDPRPAAGLLVAGLLAALSAHAAGVTTHQSWRTETTVVAAARQNELGSLDAYHYDLLTRGNLVPTLAQTATSSTVLSEALRAAGLDEQGRDRLRVRAVTTPRSASVLLVVEGDDRELVRAAAREVPAGAARAVDGLATPFVLRQVAPVTPVVTAVSELRTAAVAAFVAAWLLLTATVMWLQLEHRFRAERAEDEAVGDTPAGPALTGAPA